MMGFDVEHVGPATRELVVYMLEVKESSHLWCLCYVSKDHSDFISRVKESKKMKTYNTWKHQ
jgi:hypothetical protein